MTEVLIIKTEVVEPKVKHKVGNFYYLTDCRGYEELALIVNVQSKDCCFVRVKSGRRIGNITDITDIASISSINEDEIELMLEGTDLQAVLIDKIKITV